MPHHLPPVLDTLAAEPLRQALLARVTAGEDVIADGSGVERAGLACLQVLVGSRGSAAARGVAFGLVHPSEELTGMVRMVGLDELLAPLARKAAA